MMAEAEEEQGEKGGKVEAMGSEMKRPNSSGGTAQKSKVKVEAVAEAFTGSAEPRPTTPAAPADVSPPAPSPPMTVADKSEDAIDGTSLTVHPAQPLLSTPLLQTSPPIAPTMSPPSSYVVELRGRKDSLEPFNLSVGTFQTPLLSAAPLSPGRRASYPFALSPAFPSSSSPAMQLLSVSLSPALPPSVLLSGGSRGAGLIGEASPAPRVYSIASTMAAMTSTPSPASFSSPSQSADAGPSLLELPIAGGSQSLAAMDVVAPSPRTHHAVTSLLNAASDAQTKHSHTQSSSATVTAPSTAALSSETASAVKAAAVANMSLSASEHLQALYEKVMAEKQQQQQAEKS